MLSPFGVDNSDEILHALIAFRRQFPQTFPKDIFERDARLVSGYGDGSFDDVIVHIGCSKRSGMTNDLDESFFAPTFR